MAKTFIKLNEGVSFDFFLFGIICQHKDYRLCRELNRKLNLEMKREEDLDVFSSKRMENQSFSFFQFNNEEEDQFNLLANKSSKGLLLPEQKQMDYLFLVRPGRTKVDDQVIFDLLKEIPIVLGVYRLEAAKLKSKENLVF